MTTLTPTTQEAGTPTPVRRQIGRTGRVALSWAMAGGIGLGGVLVSLMTLTGRMSANALMLTTTGLFIIGAVLGPVVASLPFIEPKVMAVLVELLIIIGAVLLLVSLPLKQMSVARDPDDVPSVRIGGIGTVSGISGAGWGPMGVTLLILSRIEPRIAVGSSVFGRIFMAAAAVISAFILLTTGSGHFAEVVPQWELVPVILTASLATMLPGAILTSRLGRTRMSMLIATVSISLAALALARTLFF